MAIALGKLTIDTQNAVLEMKSIPVQVNMKQQHAQIEIETTQPLVLIDQSGCFSSMGLKSNMDFAIELSDLGKQKALEYIGTTAEDGDDLAAIDKGGNPICDIAERDFFPIYEFNVAFIPSERPKFDVRKGELNINFKPRELGIFNGVKYDVQPAKIESRYIPGKVHIDCKI